MAASLPLASGDTLVVRQLTGNPASGPKHNPKPTAAPAAAAHAPAPAPMQPPQRRAPAAPAEPLQRSAPTEPAHLGFSASAAPSNAEQWRSAPVAEADASRPAAIWGNPGSAVRRK